MQTPFTSLATLLESPPAWWRDLLPLASQALDLHASSVVETLDLLRTGTDAPRFVSHETVPVGEAYEAFIRRTDCVPTRENLHDLFNGLVWLAYPRTKRRLNALQSEEIERLGVSGARGPLRDALTLFDENAALLRAPASLIDALARRDWSTLFIEQRTLWQAASLAPFGHALLEKLMQPRKAITAHVWIVDALDDATIAASLTAARLVAKAFLPLPVLGVPGWWRENEAMEFYADADVFRPPRGDDGKPSLRSGK